MRRILLRALLVFVMVFLVSGLSEPLTARAQTNRLYYTVLDGDTLDSIAQAFHTSTYRIRYINYLSDADFIYPGQSLILPGFDDVQGEVTRVAMPYGQSLNNFFGSLRQSSALLNRLNYITNPDQIWGGQSLYILQSDTPQVKEIRVAGSQTGLELAVKQDALKWKLAEYNGLANLLDLVPNTALWLPDAAQMEGVDSQTQPGYSITPAFLYQGKTEELFAPAPPEGASLSGELSLMVNDSLGQSSAYTAATFPLHFFPTEDGRMVALQGIHRFTKPGLAGYILTTTYADGTTFSQQQSLLVKNQEYGMDVPLVVEPDFIDPVVTVSEWELIKTVVQDAPPEKMWTFGLQSPSPTPEIWISSYGRVRSYNDSEYIYFHSGIDYPGNTNTPVFAAAAGEVVFAQKVDVRGGATIISHGRGVYTGYWHQSQISVKVGDRVEAGQTIGMVGAEGRVTGAHLHLEVIVGGVQVDPTEWLEGMY